MSLVIDFRANIPETAPYSAKPKFLNVAYKVPTQFPLSRFLPVPLMGLTLQPQPFARFNVTLAWNTLLTSTSSLSFHPEFISIHVTSPWKVS